MKIIQKKHHILINNIYRIKNKIKIIKIIFNNYLNKMFKYNRKVNNN